jgi:hypothetical protein
LYWVQEFRGFRGFRGFKGFRGFRRFRRFTRFRVQGSDLEPTFTPHPPRS